MRSARLFRFVWRVNALLILLTGLLAVMVLAFIAVKMGKDVFGTREVRAIANTDQTEVGEHLSLAGSQLLTGSDHLLVGLQSDQDYQQSYFSKSARAIRNHAFVSPGGEPSWVYPHNKFLFSEANPLPRAALNGQSQATQAVLFVVRQQDTDGDRRLTYRDAGVIAFAKPDGTGFTEVISDVIRLVSQEVVGDRVLLMYETVKGPYVASVSLRDFSVVKQDSFPLPGGALR